MPINSNGVNAYVFEKKHDQWKVTFICLALVSCIFSLESNERPINTSMVIEFGIESSFNDLQRDGGGNIKFAL